MNKKLQIFRTLPHSNISINAKIADRARFFHGKISFITYKNHLLKYSIETSAPASTWSLNKTGVPAPSMKKVEVRKKTVSWLTCSVHSNYRSNWASLTFQMPPGLFRVHFSQIIPGILAYTILDGGRWNRPKKQSKPYFVTKTSIIEGRRRTSARPVNTTHRRGCAPSAPWWARCVEIASRWCPAHHSSSTTTTRGPRSHTRARSPYRATTDPGYRGPRLRPAAAWRSPRKPRCVGGTHLPTVSTAPLLKRAATSPSMSLVLIRARRSGRPVVATHHPVQLYAAPFGFGWWIPRKCPSMCQQPDAKS